MMPSIFFFTGAPSQVRHPELSEDDDAIRAAEITRHGNNAGERKAEREGELWKAAKADAANQSVDEQANSHRNVQRAVAPRRMTLSDGDGGAQLNIGKFG